MIRMRDDVMDMFDADPTVLQMNSGAFGMVPRSVREAQRRWSDRVEANPVRFFRQECHDELARVRAEVERFLGVGDGSTALVRNVSEGVGVILDAIGLGEGDEVVVSDHGYPTVATAAAVRGAHERIAGFAIDATDDEIVEAFRAQVTERTKLVVIDQITSPTALMLPVKAVVDAVAPVPVYVDAAHAAGTLDVDVAGLGAAFWATNLHKWCYTPRGTGALWVAPEYRDAIRPAVTSWTSARGFPASHDFPGTVDFTPMLAILDGLAFWREHGGFEIAARSTDLLRTGSEIVHRQLAMAFPGDMPAYDHGWPARTAPTMRLVPLPDGLIGDAEDAAAVYRAMSDSGVECPPVYFAGRGYIRLGGGLHVDELDYDRCAAALIAALRTVSGY